MSPYGPAVSPEAKKAADEAEAKLVKGDFSIIAGPLEDNKGKEVIPPGKQIAQNAPVLKGKNYFVEGVSAPE